MAQIRATREVLAGMLLKHGEDGLAERVASITDDELARIRTLAAYYAWSKDALALGGSMGGTRALSLATVDVLDPTGRDLHRSRTDWELQFHSTESWSEADTARDRSLRANAIREQRPSDDPRDRDPPPSC
jgi:hypothetical protein